MRFNQIRRKTASPHHQQAGGIFSGQVGGSQRRCGRRAPVHQCFAIEQCKRRPGLAGLQEVNTCNTGGLMFLRARKRAFDPRPDKPALNGVLSCKVMPCGGNGERAVIEAGRTCNSLCERGRGHRTNTKSTSQRFKKITKVHHLLNFLSSDDPHSQSPFSAFRQSNKAVRLPFYGLVMASQVQCHPVPPYAVNPLHV